MVTGCRNNYVRFRGHNTDTVIIHITSIDNGLPVNVTIPANLKAGNYLLRHEVIALHMAQSLGGAELFPGCVQLTVTGNGTIELTGNEFANFPGAYKPKDPGILVDVR